MFFEVLYLIKVAQNPVNIIISIYFYDNVAKQMTQRKVFLTFPAYRIQNSTFRERERGNFVI